MNVTPTDLAALACLPAALAVLVWLSVIDLQHYILPNPLVLTFALLGIAFHSLTYFDFLSPASMALGGVTGFGFLYSVRFFAGLYYKKDALGLGDVKLMGAAGLWLGMEPVLMAITLGAFFGLVHGLAVAGLWRVSGKGKIDIRRMVIPAGPGFAAGAAVVAAIRLAPFCAETLQKLSI